MGVLSGEKGEIARAIGMSEERTGSVGVLSTVPAPSPVTGKNACPTKYRTLTLALSRGTKIGRKRRAGRGNFDQKRLGASLRRGCLRSLSERMALESGKPQLMARSGSFQRMPRSWG